MLLLEIIVMKSTYLISNSFLKQGSMIIPSDLMKLKVAGLWLMKINTEDGQKLQPSRMSILTSQREFHM